MNEALRVARRWRRAALAGAMSLALAASAVHAQSVPERPVTVTWTGSTPRVSFTARDFLGPAVVRKLESGLPQTLVTRVYAYPENGTKPIALTLRTCRVVYDLWEEQYRVHLQRAAENRSFTTKKLGAAAEACIGAKDLSLGDVFGDYRGKRIYFAIMLELNPLSPATVQRMRRWLSKQGAQQLEGDAFFGSFVSIFVTRRMGSAERTSSFRSATHVVPP